MLYLWVGSAPLNGGKVGGLKLFGSIAPPTASAGVICSASTAWACCSFLILDQELSQLFLMLLLLLSYPMLLDEPVHFLIPELHLSCYARLTTGN